MANIKGNRIALEDTFDGRSPELERRLVQEKLGDNRSPFYTIDIPAGSQWVEIQSEGYELQILSGDVVHQMGSAPAYVMFGENGPRNLTQTDTTGAMAVLPGTILPVAQGFRRVWFLPSADSNWRLQICRVPGLHTSYGPYAYTLPPNAMLATEINGIALAPPADVVMTTDGVAIPGKAKTMTLRLFDANASVLSRLAATGPLNIYWWLANAAVGGVQLWVRNAAADDWTATARGVASATHDVERYDVSNATRVAVVDPTGWTAIGALHFVEMEMLFFG